MTKLDERLAKIESLLEQILTELRGGSGKTRTRLPPPSSKAIEPRPEDFAVVRKALRRHALRLQHKRGKTK